MDKKKIEVSLDNFRYHANPDTKLWIIFDHLKRQKKSLKEITEEVLINRYAVHSISVNHPSYKYIAFQTSSWLLSKAKHITINAGLPVFVYTQIKNDGTNADIVKYEDGNFIDDIIDSVVTNLELDSLVNTGQFIKESIIKCYYPLLPTKVTNINLDTHKKESLISAHALFDWANDIRLLAGLPMFKIANPHLIPTVDNTLLDKNISVSVNQNSSASSVERLELKSENEDEREFKSKKFVFSQKDDWT